jgi:hypothetical protein
MLVENQNSEEFDLDDAFAEAAKALDGDSNDSLEVFADEADEDTNKETEADGFGDADANAQAAQENQDDVFDVSSLPPAAQKRIQELEHKAASDSGRVSALQRQLSELQKQGKGDTKAAEKIEEQIEELQLDSALLDEIPELGNLVKFAKDTHAEMLRLRAEMQEKVVAPANQQAALARESAEIETLKTIHPDYEAIDGNPLFAQWVQSQPAAVRDLAFSDSAADVSAALTYFKQANPNYKAPVSHKKSSVVDRSIDDLVSLPGDGAMRSKTPGGDMDSLWDHAASLADKGKI